MAFFLAWIWLIFTLIAPTEDPTRRGRLAPLICCCCYLGVVLFEGTKAVAALGRRLAIFYCWPFETGDFLFTDSPDPVTLKPFTGIAESDYS